jgi:uncharacterized protein
MKLQPDIFNAQSITGYGKDWIGLGEEKIIVSVVIGSKGERFEWNCRRFEDLNEAHFELLAKIKPELVILGTGFKLRFPTAQLTKELALHRIGLEIMDTQAACRTYNILAGEGRHVLAALLIETR